MSEKAFQKNFFLISFLPALAYWYLESNYPIKIAVLGGLILAILEVVLELVFTKHVHTLSKFNFFLIALLGGLALIEDEGIWFKLQPAFTGVAIAGFLIYRLKMGKGLLVEMLETMDRPMPPMAMLQAMELHMAWFFLAYGLFMAGVALWMDTGKWLFFKTAGFYLIFLVFFVIELVFQRRLAKKLHQRQVQQDILKRF